MARSFRHGLYLKGCLRALPLLLHFTEIAKVSGSMLHVLASLTLRFEEGLQLPRVAGQLHVAAAVDRLSGASAPRMNRAFPVAHG